jgi:hypothetical protein
MPIIIAKLRNGSGEIPTTLATGRKSMETVITKRIKLKKDIFQVYFYKNFFGFE